MDDICIYSNNKAHLHSILAQCRDYLDKNLNLKIKENYQIFPTRIRGVDFVGYRFFGDFILLRKAIAKAIKRKVRYFHKAEPKPSHINSFYSYLGFLTPANTRRFYAKYMYGLDFLYRWLLDKDYKRFKEVA